MSRRITIASLTVVAAAMAACASPTAPTRACGVGTGSSCYTQQGVGTGSSNAQQGVGTGSSN